MAWLNALAATDGRAARGAGPRQGLAIDALGALAGGVALLAVAASVLHEGPEQQRAAAAGGLAAGAASTTAGFEGDTLFAGYLGSPFTHPSNARFEKPGTTDLTLHDLNWEGRPFKHPIYYGLRARRWREASAVGSMLDFTHSKAITQREQRVRVTGTRNGKPAPADTRVGDMFRHFEFSHGHNMLTFNGLLRLGQLATWLRPYVGAGAGISIPHTEIQFADETHRTYEYQYVGPAGQVLAGLEIRLPQTTIFIEYKFTLARNAAPLSGRDNKGWGFVDFPSQLFSWLRGEKPAHGTMTTILASHQVIAGTGLRRDAMPAAAAR